MKQPVVLTVRAASVSSAFLSEIQETRLLKTKSTLHKRSASTEKFEHFLSLILSDGSYCNTLNVSVSFVSRAKENREFKGREYQLQAKIGRNYYSISNCMVLIRQNKRGQIILRAKSPTFWAAKLKGFTVMTTLLVPCTTVTVKWSK